MSSAAAGIESKRETERDLYRKRRIRSGVLRPLGLEQREKNENRRGSPLYHCMTSHAEVGTHSHSTDSSSPFTKAGTVDCVY